MSRILLCLGVVLGLAGSARGDEVQAARDRALTLLNRSIALSNEVAQQLKAEQSRTNIFDILLKAVEGDITAYPFRPR